MAGRRNLILVGALFGLIALVAVASRGHAPAGSGGTHGLDSKLIWEFVLLAFLALFIICFPVAAWVIMTTRLEAQAVKKRRQRASLRIFIFMLLLTVDTTAWVLRADRTHEKHMRVSP